MDPEPPAYDDVIDPADIASRTAVDSLLEEDMVTDGDCIWRDDFPLWGPATNELSVEDKQLVEWAVSRRSIVTDGITYFVYCRNIAGWSQLESSEAANELLEVTDTKAPVNYDRALKRFYPLLKRIAYPVGHIEPSVCIGS